VKREPLHRKWAEASAQRKEFVYQQGSTAIHVLRAVGIVWTDPGTHNVLYHDDDLSVVDFECIELCNGEEVMHRPKMTVIFGPEAVQQRRFATILGRLGKCHRQMAANMWHFARTPTCCCSPSPHADALFHWLRQPLAQTSPAYMRHTTKDTYASSICHVVLFLCFASFSLIQHVGTTTTGRG
jgi:hypothetical protein